MRLLLRLFILLMLLTYAYIPFIKIATPKPSALIPSIPPQPLKPEDFPADPDVPSLADELKWRDELDESLDPEATCGTYTDYSCEQRMSGRI